MNDECGMMNEKSFDVELHVFGMINDELQLRTVKGNNSTSYFALFNA